MKNSLNTINSISKDELDNKLNKYLNRVKAIRDELTNSKFQHKNERQPIAEFKEEFIELTKKKRFLDMINKILKENEDIIKNCSDNIKRILGVISEINNQENSKTIKKSAKTIEKKIITFKHYLREISTPIVVDVNNNKKCIIQYVDLLEKIITKINETNKIDEIDVIIKTIITNEIKDIKEMQVTDAETDSGTDVLQTQVKTGAKTVTDTVTVGTEEAETEQKKEIFTKEFIDKIKDKIETFLNNKNIKNETIAEILLYILTCKYTTSIDEIHDEKKEIEEYINSQFQGIVEKEIKNIFSNFSDNIDNYIKELIRFIELQNYDINKIDERKIKIKEIIDKNIKENEKSIHDFLEKINSTDLTNKNSRNYIKIEDNKSITKFSDKKGIRVQKFPKTDYY